MDIIIKDVIKQVCTELDIDNTDLIFDKSRKAILVKARCIISFILVKIYHLHENDMAKIFKRDRSSIYHFCAVAEYDFNNSILIQKLYLEHKEAYLKLKIAKQKINLEQSLKKQQLFKERLFNFNIKKSTYTTIIEGLPKAYYRIGFIQNRKYEDYVLTNIQTTLNWNNFILPKNVENTANWAVRFSSKELMNKFRRKYLNLE